MLGNARVKAVIGSIALTSAALAGAATSGPAHADPGGSGHIYKCERISMSDSYFTISFSRLQTCSTGEMDNSIIHELSTYTDKQTGSITGECAWHAYYHRGMRNMTNIWNWCLGDPRWAN